MNKGEHPFKQTLRDTGRLEFKISTKTFICIYSYLAGFIGLNSHITIHVISFVLQFLTVRVMSKNKVL
jgi:hypothetical protein